MMASDRQSATSAQDGAEVVRLESGPGSGSDTRDDSTERRAQVDQVDRLGATSVSAPTAPGGPSGTTGAAGAAGATVAAGAVGDGSDQPTPSQAAKKGVPEGLWMSCPACGAMLFRKLVESCLRVCPKCQHHMRVSGRERILQLADERSFEPLNATMAPADPLEFVDLKPYGERIVTAQRATGENDGVQTGFAFVKGRKLVLCAMDFTFMGGSMGSVIGEKLTRAIEIAGDRDLPVVIVSCSGGARMQESGFSLMQMAKISAALARFDEQGGLYISVLADPTTGGVTASFAMLGDVIIAEPGALIGFAGPRVIAQTIRQELPEGFQTAEFLLASGFVDRIVHRAELRNEIGRIIDYAGK